MSVELNHTIVLAHDKQATARHLTALLGLPDRTTFGPFAVVTARQRCARPNAQHHAFLVSEREFDRASSHRPPPRDGDVSTATSRQSAWGTGPQDWQHSGAEVGATGRSGRVPV